LIALDTSVVVAAFASWHEGHASAIATLARRPRLPAHVFVEAYSVLTRLPPPHRAPPDVAAAFLRERFPGTPLSLPSASQRDLVDFAARSGMLGGAIYDALVAATARRASATLFTRDRRAIPIYEAVGVQYELLT
jgi:predicted nucleic acid-binding protein